MCHRDGRIGPAWLPSRRTRIDPATVERYRSDDRQGWMDPPCTKAYATIKGVPLAVLTQDRQRAMQSAHPRTSLKQSHAIPADMFNGRGRPLTFAPSTLTRR
jgi:hypothetical protein